MEALSPTMEEGQVVRWLKTEGDAVIEGEILAEIETDKATMELVARGEGVLRRVVVGEGETAPVGEVIAVIADEDEDIAGLVPVSVATNDATASPPTSPTGDPTSARAQPAAATGAGAETQPTPLPTPGGRVKASPVARRLAAEMRVDLATVAGSGTGGRVVKSDVEAAVSAKATDEGRAIESGAAVVATPALAPIAEYEDVPLTQIRKTVARRLAESLGPVPHFYLSIDVDMTRALKARQKVNALLAANGRKASINDFVIKAAAVALTHHPECNAWWQDGFIRRFNRVHMGVAVAVPDGLITPVVRDAHAKGLGEISAEVREMAGRARERKLQPEEYTGSTFSISNLGMFGIEEFSAVINPPEAAIIAVGGVEERPVVVAGEVVVRPRMRITMSCDHRVIDGATGAQFLATLKAFLEEPATALI